MRKRVFSPPAPLGPHAVAGPQPRRLADLDELQTSPGHVRDVSETCRLGAVDLDEFQMFFQALALKAS